MAYAVAEPRLITADELERMPQDGVRRELIRGELREMPSPGFQHSRIAARFVVRLGAYVEARALGTVHTDVACRLSRDPDTVLSPDAAFVRSERVAALQSETAPFLGAPDLVVEVVSPGDSADAVEEKVWEWRWSGCRMVIVINPRRRSATVYQSSGSAVHLGDDDVLDGGEVVPGWTLRISELFD